MDSGQTDRSRLELARANRLLHEKRPNYGDPRGPTHLRLKLIKDSLPHTPAYQDKQWGVKSLTCLKAFQTHEALQITAFTYSDQPLHDPIKPLLDWMMTTPITKRADFAGRQGIVLVKFFRQG